MNRSRRLATQKHFQNDSVQSGKVLKSKSKAPKKLIGVKRSGKGKTSKHRDVQLTAAKILQTDTASIINTTNVGNNISKKISVRRFVQQKSVSTQTNKIVLKSPIRTSGKKYSSVVKDVGNSGTTKQATESKIFHIQKKGRSSVSKISVGYSNDNSSVIEDNSTNVSPFTGSSIKIVKKRRDQVETPGKVKSAKASPRFGKIHMKIYNKTLKQKKSRSLHKSHVTPNNPKKEIYTLLSNKRLRNGKVAEKDDNLSYIDTPTVGLEVQRLGVMKVNADKTVAPLQKRSKTRNYSIRFVTQKGSRKHAGKAQIKIKPARKRQTENDTNSKTRFKKTITKQSNIFETLSQDKPITKKSGINVKKYLDYSVADDEEIMDFIGLDTFETNQKSALEGGSSTKRDARFLVSPKQRNLSKNFLAHSLLLSPAKSTAKSNNQQTIKFQNFSSSISRDTDDVTVDDNLDIFERAPQGMKNARKESHLSRNKQTKKSKLSKHEAKRSLFIKNKKSSASEQKSTQKSSTAGVNKKKCTFDENKSAAGTVLDVPVRVSKRQQSDNETEAPLSKKARFSLSPSLRKDLKSLPTTKPKSLSHLVETAPKQSAARKKKKEPKSKSQLNKISTSPSTRVIPKHSKAKISQDSVIPAAILVHKILEARKQTVVSPLKKDQKKLSVHKHRISSSLSSPAAENVSSQSLVSVQKSRVSKSSSQEIVPKSVPTQRVISLHTRKTVKNLSTVQRQVKKVKKSLSPAINTNVGLSPSSEDDKLEHKKNAGPAQTKYSKKLVSLRYEGSPKHSIRKKRSSLISPRKIKTFSPSKFLGKKKTPKTSKAEVKKSQLSSPAIHIENKSGRNKIVGTTSSLRKKQTSKVKKSPKLSTTLEGKKLFSPIQKGARKEMAAKMEKMSPVYIEQGDASKSLRGNKIRAATFSTSPKKATSLEKKKTAKSTHDKMLSNSNKSSKLFILKARKSLTPAPRRTNLDNDAEIEKIHLDPPGKMDAAKLDRNDTQEMTFSKSPKKTSPRKKKTMKIMTSKIVSDKKRTKLSVKMKAKLSLSPTLRRTRLGENEKIHLVSPERKESSKSLQGEFYVQKTTSSALPKEAVPQGKKKKAKLTSDNILSLKKSTKLSGKSKVRKSLSQTLRRIRLDKILESENIHLVSQGQVSSKSSPSVKQMRKTRSTASPKKTTTPKKKKMVKPTPDEILANKKSLDVLTKTDARKSCKQMPEMAKLDEAAKIKKIYQVFPGKREAEKSLSGVKQMRKTRSTASPKKITTPRKKKMIKPTPDEILALKKSPKLSGKSKVRESLSRTLRRTKLDKTVEVENFQLVSRQRKVSSKPSSGINQKGKTRSTVLPKKTTAPRKNKLANPTPGKILTNKKSLKVLTKTDARKSLEQMPEMAILDEGTVIEKIQQVFQGKMEASKLLPGRNQMAKTTFASPKKSTSPRKKKTAKMKPSKIFANTKSPKLPVKMRAKISLSPTLRITRLGESEKIHLVSPQLKESSKSLQGEFLMQKTRSSALPKKAVPQEKKKKVKLTSDNILSLKRSPKLSGKSKVRKSLSQSLRRTRLDKILESENIHLVSQGQVSSKSSPSVKQMRKTRSTTSPKKTTTPKKKKLAKQTQGKILANKKSLKVLSKTDARKSLKQMPEMAILDESAVIEKIHQVFPRKKEASKLSPGRYQMAETSFASAKKTTPRNKRKTAKITSSKIFSNKKGPKLSVKMGVGKSISSTQRTRLNKITEVGKICFISLEKTEASKPLSFRINTKKTTSRNKTVPQEIKKTANSAPSKLYLNKNNPKLLTIKTKESLTQSPRKTKVNWATGNEKINLIPLGRQNNISKLLPNRSETRETTSSVSPKKSTASGKKRTAKRVSSKMFSNKKGQNFTVKMGIIKSFSPTSKVSLRLGRVAKIDGNSQVSLQENTSKRGRNHMREIISGISASLENPVSPGKKLTSGKRFLSKKSPKLTTKMKARKSLSLAPRSTRLRKFKKISLISSEQKKASKPLSCELQMSKSTSSTTSSKKVISQEKQKRAKLSLSQKMSPNSSAEIRARRSLFSPTSKRMESDMIENISLISLGKKRISKPLSVRKPVKNTRSTAVAKQSVRRTVSRAPKRNKGVESVEEAITVSFQKTGKESAYNRSLKMTQSSSQNYSTASPTYLTTSYTNHEMDFPSCIQRAAETPSRIIDIIYARQTERYPSLGRRIAKTSSTRTKLINSYSKTPLSKIMDTNYSQKAKYTSHELNVPSSSENVGSSYARPDRISPSPGKARTESHIHNINYTRKGRLAPSLVKNTTASSQAWSEDLSCTEESMNIPALNVAATSPESIVENYRSYSINTPYSIQTKSGTSSMLLDSSRNYDQGMKDVINTQPSLIGRHHLATDVRNSKLIRRSYITSSNDSENFNVADRYKQDSFEGQAEDNDDLDVKEVEENEELEESRDQMFQRVNEEGRYDGSATRSKHSQRCTIS